MAAEREEVVVDADPWKIQHLCIDLADRGLRFGGRWKIGCGTPLRLGERLPVELSVGGQGQGGQQREAARRHVIGEYTLQMLPSSLDELLWALAGKDSLRSCESSVLGTAAIDGIDSRAPQNFILLYMQREAGHRECFHDELHPAFQVVDFDHDLLNFMPVLRRDSLKYVQFALLDIHLQQIDRFDLLFRDDLGEGSQLAGELLRFQAIFHQLLNGCAGHFQMGRFIAQVCCKCLLIVTAVGKATGHHRIVFVPDKLSGSTLAGQPAVEYGRSGGGVDRGIGS